MLFEPVFVNSLNLMGKGNRVAKVIVDPSNAEDTSGHFPRFLENLLLCDYFGSGIGPFWVYRGLFMNFFP